MFVNRATYNILNPVDEPPSIRAPTLVQHPRIRHLIGKPNVPPYQGSLHSLSLSIASFHPHPRYKIDLLTLNPVGPQRRYPRFIGTPFVANFRLRYPNDEGRSPHYILT